MAHKDIHAAKLSVMAEVPYVKKSRTQGLNYSFASEAEFIARLQPALVKHGITVAPVQVEVLDRSNYTTSKGSVMHRILIRSTYRLTHSESGTHEDVVVLGEAADSGDKCASKAMTGAYKYAFRQPFAVETGDDPDRYSSEEQEEAPKTVDAQKAIEKVGELGLKFMSCASLEEVDKVAAECREAYAAGLLGSDVSWLKKKQAEAKARLGVGG